MQSSEPATRHPAPFAPLPPRARLTFVWAAPLIAIAFLGAANLAAVPFLLPLILLQLEQIAAAGAFEMTPLALAVTVIVSFFAFGASAVLWARVFERRGPATLGFVRGPWRYLIGFALGVVLAVLLLCLSAIAAPEDSALFFAGMRRMLGEGGAALLLILFGLFVLQTGAEEVVFRGWMLSCVTARRGPLIGVAVSSIGFALVHAHYLLFAPLPGLFAVFGVGFIGIILAFYALAERSIWGVCGLHCAYNFVVMTTATAVALGEQPDVSPVDVIVSALTEITSITEFDPSLVTSAALLALLAAGAWLFWRRAAAAAQAGGSRPA